MQVSSQLHVPAIYNRNWWLSQRVFWNYEMQWIVLSHNIICFCSVNRKMCVLPSSALKYTVVIQLWLLHASSSLIFSGFFLYFPTELHECKTFQSINICNERWVSSGCPYMMRLCRNNRTQFTANWCGFAAVSKASEAQQSAVNHAWLPRPGRFVYGRPHFYNLL